MESGSAFWLILLTFGVIALGAAMAYGLRRNQTRTAAEKSLTEAATRREYQVEDEHSK